MRDEGMELMCSRRTLEFILLLFTMPNWVYNEVKIAAPLSEVQAYLFETVDPESVRG